MVVVRQQIWPRRQSSLIFTVIASPPELLIEFCRNFAYINVGIWIWTLNSASKRPNSTNKHLLMYETISRCCTILEISDVQRLPNVCIQDRLWYEFSGRPFEITYFFKPVRDKLCEYVAHGDKNDLSEDGIVVVIGIHIIHKLTGKVKTNKTKRLKKCPCGCTGKLTLGEKMSHDMTKPTMWLCAQRRLRSAWVSAQSDQSLRCPHEESLGS